MTILDGLARALARAGSAVSAAGRTVVPADSNPVPAAWTHVTKVDPEDEKTLPLLYPLYLRHTDAVSVGGSADVTAQNTEETFDLLAPGSRPVFHEPSDPRQGTRRTYEQADLLAIPEVLNGDSASLVGQLGAGVEHVREELAPDLLADRLPWLPGSAADPLANFVTSWLLAEAVFEAYVVQNPDSAAAREAGVSEADLLSPREAKQRAMAAERHLGSELVYLEYSGTYGGEEATEALREMSAALSWSRLWYGGGLDSRERALGMLDAGADAVVVGDVFHRIAAEEAAICERAAEDLDADATEDLGTDAAAVREWVRENVAVADSNATSYLATIPSVRDPGRLAERYLTATVRTWLALRKHRDEGDRSTTAGVAVTEGNPSTDVDLRRLLGEEMARGLAAADAALVRRCLRALLADPDEREVPTAHIELSSRS